MDEKQWIEAHLNALGISTYCVARSKGRRMKRQEPLLALNPQIAYLYSLKVLRGRFKEGEPSMATSPEWAVRYARFVLKGRFIPAERHIAKSPEWAYEYATKVVCGRLPPKMHRAMAMMTSNYFAKKYMTSQLGDQCEKRYDSEPPEKET